MAHFATPTPEQVEKLLPPLAEIAVRWPVLWLSPERLEVWDSVHDVLIVRRNESLSTLREGVLTILGDLGITHSTQYGYTPHVTLIRAAATATAAVANNAIIPVRALELAGLHGIVRYTFPMD